MVLNAKEFNVYVRFNKAGVASTRSGEEATVLGLPGYLSDDGLSISLKNNFAPSLEFAGGLFDNARSLVAGGSSYFNLNEFTKAITDVFSGGSLSAAATTIFTKALDAGAGVKGYIQTGMLLNSPYYWQGTLPIEFNLTMYQIANTEGVILRNYQSALRFLSPSTSIEEIEGDGFFKTLAKKFTDSNAIIQVGAMGPSLLDVYYFPETITEEGGATGGVQFQNCLCKDFSCDIKAPYDKLHSPIIGIFKFTLQTSRILDASQISKIFGMSDVYDAPPKTSPAGTNTVLWPPTGGYNG